MFGIPEWAMGVGAIILFGALGIVLMVRFLPHEMTGRKAAERDGASRAAALDDLQRRVAELEDRVDFAERLLAKQKDGERIAPPQR